MHEGVCDHGPPSSPVVIIPRKDQVLVDEVAVPEFPLLLRLIIGVEVVGISRATETDCSVGRDLWPPSGGSWGRLLGKKASSGEGTSRHMADGVTATKAWAGRP